METSKKVSKLQSIFGAAETIKGMITISLSVICLLIFCTCALFGKNQLDVGISLAFSGLDLVRLAFLGGEYVDEYWMDDGKGNGFFLDLTVTYPTFIALFAIVGILLMAALIAFQALRYTKFKNNSAMSKWVAVSSLALSAFFFIVYVYAMFCKTATTTFEGKEVEFYRVFEVKVTLLLVALCLLANGFIELKLQEKTIPAI